jgi:prohibitin 2
LIGQALQKSPAFIELKRIEVAKEIATMVQQGRSRVFLDSSNLLLNISQPFDENFKGVIAGR